MKCIPDCSKLSATLPSLFLDEGFSTLDAESQSRVADALQVLQGGKRLIGIVTHVPALADQMPARIEIERTLSGSRVRQARGLNPPAPAPLSA
jgi:exonuclease SbcC